MKVRDIIFFGCGVIVGQLSLASYLYYTIGKM